MATIDLSNYSTSLYQASTSGFLDGNVYFDKTNGTLEFGDATDFATLDLTGHGGGASDANPLIRLDGLKFEAIYAFENQERKDDETLRAYNRWTSGTFKFGGAYNMINGRKFADDASRALIRGSGWNEYDENGAVGRVYFGVKGLGSIEASSQPYYQTAQYASSTAFNKTGNIDEATQVKGDIAIDDTTTTFDNTGSSMYMSIRTYGKNYDRINTLGTLGISELGGYSTGAALNESDHLTTDESTAHPLADVFTTPIAPWDGMTLERIDASFTTAAIFSGGTTGTFSWRLNNTGGGSLVQCVAYLDAIAQADEIVSTGDNLTLIGKDYDTWYTYTPAGKIQPISGAGDGDGLFIDNLPVADRNSVEFVDDGSTTRIYPVYTPVTVEIGQGAIDDTEAWYHCFNFTDYNTASATDYLDASDVSVKGVADNTSDFISAANTYVEWSHDHTGDGDTQVVFLCEGDGEVTQAKTTFTISSTASSQNCVPAAETNV